MTDTITNNFLFFCDIMGFKSKFRNFKECAINSMIYDTYYNKDLDENLVYLESFKVHGYRIDVKI